MTHSQPHNHGQKTFWIVMKRGSRGTCMERLNNEEYKTEGEALHAAEDAAKRGDARAEFFTLQCIARTTLKNVTTERLCGC